MFIELFKVPKLKKVAKISEILANAEIRVAHGNVRAQYGKILKSKEIQFRRQAILSAKI
jgi:hypothetical protein